MTENLITNRRAEIKRHAVSDEFFWFTVTERPRLHVCSVCELEGQMHLLVFDNQQSRFRDDKEIEKH